MDNVIASYLLELEALAEAQRGEYEQWLAMHTPTAEADEPEF